MLVAGGCSLGCAIANAELYDPATRSWSATGSMIDARDRHTATRLNDGRVLVAGGGGHVVIDVFPWIGLGIGVLLVALGLWLVMGRTLYTSLMEQLATRLGSPGQKGIRGFFMFGVAYGIASLSCTLPIFLSVIGSTIAVQGYLFRVTQFVSYALGMGLVISVLTLALALFKGAAVGLLRQALPYFQAFSAVLLLLAGVYIIYYWLTVGQLAQKIF